MYRLFFKRFFDCLFAVLLLIPLAPIMLLVALAIKLDSKGPAIFKQIRSGKNNKEFMLYKFRSMTCNNDIYDKSKEDQLTKVGKFIRKTSLDELPELFNILTGDMSIVGPRPQLVRDMVFMSKEQRRRHDVRPGLTGHAQVNGRNNITWEQKFEYDLEYIDNGITFINDVKIVLQTVGKVVKRSDTVREGTVSDMDFGDWLMAEGKVDKEVYDTKQAEAKELLNV